MRVLVLGATGMLGSAMIRVLSEKENWEVFGTVRSEEGKRFFAPKIGARLVVGCDVENDDALGKLFGQVRPEVVINCISLAKRLLNAGDPLLLIPIYALLPHRLAKLCSLFGARLVHVSTDGVFSGTKGGYKEDDPADARDLYGISKLLGEVHYPHTITLRTSMIGHELQAAHGLLGRFLSQRERCTCFGRAIFSGLPTVARQIVRDWVIHGPPYSGCTTSPRVRSQYDLLRLVAGVR
jgi:dTDP-4-dehydrorhamnose reductase